MATSASIDLLPVTMMCMAASLVLLVVQYTLLARALATICHKALNAVDTCSTGINLMLDYLNPAAPHHHAGGGSDGLAVVARAPPPPPPPPTAGTLVLMPAGMADCPHRAMSRLGSNQFLRKSTCIQCGARWQQRV